MCPALLSSWPSKKGNIFRQVCQKTHRYQFYMLSVYDVKTCTLCCRQLCLDPYLGTANYDGCIAKIS